MSKHYIMLYSPPWAGPTPKRLKGTEKHLNRGQRLSDDPGEFEFLLEVAPQADNQIEFPPLDWQDPDRGHTLFSKKMRDVLAFAGVDNIDYYPAKVTYEPTGEDLDYCVANVIGLIEGLDHDSSDLKVGPRGIVFGIMSMVFDEEKMNANRFFRLREKSNFIVVDEALKSVLEESGLTGMEFIEDKGYEPGMI